MRWKVRRLISPHSRIHSHALQIVKINFEEIISFKETKSHWIEEPLVELHFTKESSIYIYEKDWETILEKENEASIKKHERGDSGAVG